MTPLSLPTSRTTGFLAGAYAVVLGALPTLLMITMEGGSAGFYLAILLSIVLLLVPSAAPRLLPGSARRYAWMGIGMGVMLVGVLISLGVHGIWKGSEVEKAARLLSMLLILFAALRVPRRILARAMLGTLPAVWSAAAIIGWLALETGVRPATQQFNAVTYGDLTLLFGVLSLMSLGLPVTRFTRIEATLKLLTGILGLVAFLWTQTRGGLLAIPCFLLIGLLVMGRRPGRMKILLGLVLAAGVGIVATHDGALRDRIDAGVSEYGDCSADHLADTSVCIRLQLWTAAGYMIREQPVFGVGGGDRFRQELERLAGQGKVSAMVARDFGETHNDLLYFLATYGVLGGLGLVLVYVAPALVFVPRLWRGDERSRLHAAAGLSICVAFAVFGVTEMMLRDMRTASFYAAWVALLLALSEPRRSDQAEASTAS